MPVAWEIIEPLLMQAAKPARYTGGEFNQVIKPEARVRVCLAFPDLYEIGMSYHGYRLLYERINEQPGWAAERAYVPWPDFEAQLRRHHVPLYSLETRRALTEFDWVGITLQHEVNFTNILTLLDLSGIPLESRDRTAPFPILIGGGEGAYSPESMTPFLDAFTLGDGEDVCLEITALIERAKDAGWDRRTTLGHLAQLPGVYVPEFYDVAYKADGTIDAVTVREDLRGPLAPPPVIHRRYFDVANDLGSVRPVVPLARTVHDRLAIEIRRGCVNGCRFCQAGMLTRPVHERPVDQIIEIARRGVESTGYDEISLLSLSSADYTMIVPLLERFTRELGSRGVSVSLPSLRINGFDVKLVDEIARVRKSGFTFAPEAGTTRLRQVINKPVDQERFFEIIEDVFRRGWRTVKFYFMLGLPTETDEDLDGIVEICERAARLGHAIHRQKATINVTLSPFVPKSNTPFQWEGQTPPEELQRRYQYVRRAVLDRCGRTVSVKSADIGQSFIEACLARGDRRLARVVRRAWELGAHFDGWEEYFNLGLWLRAFEECGLDPAWYANRQRGEDEILPFEHLESDVGHRFFRADQRRSRQERTVEKCDTGNCAGCEVCADTIHHSLAKDMPLSDEDRTALPAAAAPVPSPPEVPPAEPDSSPADQSGPKESRERGRRREQGSVPHPMPPPVQRLRLTYSRRNALNYISHLDFMKVMFLVLRRAGAPLAYSQGFNPQPRVQLAPPMSLGMSGEGELMDVMLAERMDGNALLDSVNAVPLDGLRFHAVAEIPLGADSLEAQIAASTFRLELTADTPGKEATFQQRQMEAFFAADSFPIEITKKEKPFPVDLRRSVLSAAMKENDGQPVFTLTITHEPGRFVKPHDALGAILDRPLALGIDVRVARAGFVLGPKATQEKS